MERLVEQAMRWYLLATDGAMPLPDEEIQELLDLLGHLQAGKPVADWFEAQYQADAISETVLELDAFVAGTRAVNFGFERTESGEAKDPVTAKFGGAPRTQTLLQSLPKGQTLWQSMWSQVEDACGAELPAYLTLDTLRGPIQASIESIATTPEEAVAATQLRGYLEGWIRQAHARDPTSHLPPETVLGFETALWESESGDQLRIGVPSKLSLRLENAMGCILTAYNPMGQERTKEENESAQAGLEAQLEDLPTIRVQSHDGQGGFLEQGLLIDDPRTLLFEELAWQMGQAAIVLVPKGGVPEIRYLCP